MVNLKKVAKGVSIFLAGYFMMIVLSWIIPILTTVLEAIYPSDGIDGIIWVAVMMVWVIAVLVIPNLFIYEGIRETNDLPSILQITISIIVFLFGVILTVKGWYFVEALSTASQNEFVIALYWIAVAVMWFEIVVGIPAFTIIQNMQQPTN